jgi:hypothetical protein
MPPVLHNISSKAVAEQLQSGARAVGRQSVRGSGLGHLPVQWICKRPHHPIVDCLRTRPFRCLSVPKPESPGLLPRSSLVPRSTHGYA